MDGGLFRKIAYLYTRKTDVLYKMINRLIIRVKVLQIVYAYYQKESHDLKSAENELMFSLQKAYDLYHYLLSLILCLTDAEQKRLDRHKHKLLATEEELNPNTRFIDNRFAAQLQQNEHLSRFTSKNGYLWSEGEDGHLIKKMLLNVLESEDYKIYLETPDSYESDRELWRKLLKNIILESEDLSESLEEKSIYWEDDLGIVGTFVLKTIKRFSAESDKKQELLPMFKDEDDRQFAIRLLHRSILEKEENNERITRQIKNWDIDRIANMDLYIMQIALAELKNFESIPVNVTLNEYIDLARYYSTPKSAHFINGILDAIVQELKSEGIIFKN